MNYVTAEGIHADWNFPNIVVRLRTSREETHCVRKQGRIREMPSRDALQRVVAGVAAVLFPTHYG